MENGVKLSLKSCCNARFNERHVDIVLTVY